MSALAKPETFQDLVRDRVRTVIMDSIPAEQIDNLIKKEYDNMFKSEYHGRKSPFQEMVAVEIKAFLAERLKEYVKTQLTGTWVNNTEEATKSAVEQFAPAALRAVMGQVVSTALSNFHSQLQNVGRNY